MAVVGPRHGVQFPQYRLNLNYTATHCVDPECQAESGSRWIEQLYMKFNGRKYKIGMFEESGMAGFFGVPEAAEFCYAQLPQPCMFRWDVSDEWDRMPVVRFMRPVMAFVRCIRERGREVLVDLDDRDRQFLGAITVEVGPRM